MGKMFLAASNYLPAQVSDMMNQDRAFATGRLNFSGQKNICTLSTYVGHHPLSTPRHTHVPKAQTPQTHAQGKNKSINRKKRGEGQEEG